MGKKLLRMAILLAALFGIMLFCSCSAYQYDEDYLEENSSSAQNEEETVTINDIFYDFDTVDLDGNAVSKDFFADYDLTLVNIWATWCGPCKNELPHLQTVADEFADEGFAVLGILHDGASSKDYTADEKAIENAQLLMEDAGASYTVIIPDEMLFKGILAAVTAFPTSFFVDSEGKILDKSVVIGALDEEGWMQVVQDMLDQVNGTDEDLAAE